MIALGNGVSRLWSAGPPLLKWEALRYLTLANVRIDVKITCGDALPIRYPLN